MSIFFSRTCVLLLVAFYAKTASSLWNFAVTTNSKIIFYDEHWREVTSSAHQFNKLTAITFDDTEEIVYFSDQLYSNGSIFSLKLPINLDDPHIIDKIVWRTQNETITSIAYDPLNRNLFWIDKQNNKIYFMSIDTTVGHTPMPKVFLDLNNENDGVPYGLAIDICRRNLFWTSSNLTKRTASIERIDLDGTNRKTIVHENLYIPRGIAVCQLTDRIHYINDLEGIHFAIESVNLDGTDRKVHVKSKNNVPFHLAVTREAIFWTDAQQTAIWSVQKLLDTNDGQTNETISPIIVQSLDERPYGIAVRSNFLTSFQNDQHCAGIVKKVKTRLLIPKPTANPINLEIQKYRRNYCLNDGEYIESRDICICKIGYKGARCQTSECHNFCVHGVCTMSNMAFPKCTCQKGFYGERCQSFKCTGYCLNEGQCTVEANGEPSCECNNNFGGTRCEHNSTEICGLYCSLLKYDPDIYVPFGCHDICEELAAEDPTGAVKYAIPQYKHLEICKNPNWTSNVIIICVTGALLGMIILLLFVHTLRRFYKPARPRIKKTFRVLTRAPRSTDTPLTNRPIATEQCEITIENCCNMNICDTPCFDPALMQQTLACDGKTKEDKKMLIPNMEEDLY